MQLDALTGCFLAPSSMHQNRAQSHVYSHRAVSLPPSPARHIKKHTCIHATSPADVVKVRLQLARSAAAAAAAGSAKPPGMLATGLNVVRTEGVTALWSGLGPSLARGFFFGGARLGMYTPIKAAICGDNAKPPLEMKILSGSISGGLAAAITSPIELVKTRLQVRFWHALHDGEAQLGYVHVCMCACTIGAMHGSLSASATDSSHAVPCRTRKSRPHIP